jgi:hypothetical protein
MSQIMAFAVPFVFLATLSCEVPNNGGSLKRSTVAKARISVSSMEASLMAELIGDVYGSRLCRPVCLQQIDAAHRPRLAGYSDSAPVIFAEGDAIVIEGSISAVSDVIQLVERLECQSADSSGGQ